MQDETYFALGRNKARQRAAGDTSIHIHTYNKIWEVRLSFLKVEQLLAG